MKALKIALLALATASAGCKQAADTVVSPAQASAPQVAAVYLYSGAHLAYGKRDGQVHEYH